MQAFVISKWLILDSHWNKVNIHVAGQDMCTTGQEMAPPRKWSKGDSVTIHSWIRIKFNNYNSFLNSHQPRKCFLLNYQNHPGRLISRPNTKVDCHTNLFLLLITRVSQICWAPNKPTDKSCKIAAASLIPWSNLLNSSREKAQEWLETQLIALPKISTRALYVSANARHAS
jgi:hypothetical protein